MKINFIVTFLIALVAVACADPAANKPKALTSEPVSNISTANSGSATDAKPAGAALSFSEVDSKIEFIGSKVTGKHDGGFEKFKGVVEFVGEKAESSKVSVEIEMASVFSDADGLTKHLQTGDFFEVEKYPKATFVSTKIEPDTAKGANNFNVTGDLELRGVKKSITFPATINVTPNEVSVQAEFSINRKDFGILYAGKADDLIRDDVVLKLDLKPSRVK